MTEKNTLDNWLERLEQMQPERIELGLSRISRVAVLAGLDQPGFRIVTVGGTNGKGSTVAYIAGLLASQNLVTGVYTSPHFVQFNERVVVNDEPVSADELCDAFALVDRVRGDIELTYFEFTTLAAIHCFSRRNVDVAVMEVGLGGRLDAVNAWDSEVACITSVGIDHIDWLGDNREQIGFEKAGIARSGCALICGESDPPDSVARTVAQIGANLHQIGRDFNARQLTQQWEYSDVDGASLLPVPAIPGTWAIGNAAVAICATRQLLGYQLAVSDIGPVLQGVRVAGRMQLVDYQNVSVLLDVAHNPDAARLLSAYLDARPVKGRTTAVFSCMQDKDIDSILHEIYSCIDRWCIAELDFPRAVETGRLKSALGAVGADSVDVFATVTTAFDQAVAQSVNDDRVIVFGSFHVVGPVLSRLSHWQRQQ